MLNHSAIGDLSIGDLSGRAVGGIIGRAAEAQKLRADDLTYAGQDPIRDGSMKDIVGRLGVICAQMAASCEALDTIGDRAFGPAPTPMSGAPAPAARPQQPGLAYQISELLTQIAEVQDRTRDAIQRVGSAI